MSIVFARIYRHPYSDGEGGAALPTPDPRTKEINDVRESVEAKHGLKLDPSVMEPIVALGDCYLRLDETFRGKKPQDVSPGELASAIAQIEGCSMKIAQAASVLPPNPEISQPANPVRAAHTEFAQRLLGQQLFQSPFGDWLAHARDYAGRQGDVVSMAILLDDPFLRSIIAGMPQLAALVRKHPIQPQTALGYIVEKDLLGVPVATDHEHRLHQLRAMKQAIIDRPEIVGLTAADALEFSNIACGTSKEDAEIIYALAGSNRAGKVTFHLIDGSEGALTISQLRVGHALQQYSENEPQPTVVPKRCDVTQFLELLPERITTLDTSALPKVHCAVAAGIMDYLSFDEQRGLLLAMALSLKSDGIGVGTKVLHHGHEHQQELLLGWRINYCDAEHMRRLGEQLKADLDALRERFPDAVPAIPEFNGVFRSDLTSSEAVCKSPELLKKGEFCVTLTPGATNGFLMFRLNK